MAIWCDPSHFRTPPPQIVFPHGPVGTGTSDTRNASAAVRLVAGSAHWRRVTFRFIISEQASRPDHLLSRETALHETVPVIVT